MSQEQPPIRSRRALRQARDERLEVNPESGTPDPGVASPASDTPALSPSVSTPPADKKPGTVPPAGVVDPGGPTEADVTGRRRIPGPVDTVRSTAHAGTEGTLAGSGPLTRRQLRLLQLAAETAPATAATSPSGAGDTPAAPGAQGPAGMTVEQALAARALLARQARNQLAKMEHINAMDPDAAAKRKLAEQTSKPEQDSPSEPDPQPEPERNDPATANNLAMVTPLEFVQVPGIERPVMKRPATSHIPVTAMPGVRASRSRKSSGRSQRSARADAPGQGAEGSATNRAGVSAAAPDLNDRAPVAANAAYGLDPLDADTAGLGRARRLHVLQLAVVGLGVIALIIGIILVITGLSG